MHFLLSILIRSTLVLIISGFLLLLLRKKSASLRHWIISLTMIGLLALPFFKQYIPSIEVEVAISDKWGLPEKTKQRITTIESYEQKQTEAPQVRYTGNKSKAIASLNSNNVNLSPSFTINWEIMVIGIWSFGLCFFLCRLFAGIFSIWQITKNSKPFLHKKLLEKESSISILVSPEIGTPMTWGFFNPVILLPEVAKGWNREILTIVIQHEVAHIKRGDYGIHMLSLFSVALYWFHPLMWWMKKHQLSEREKACDEYVLNTGLTSIQYAEQLVNVARQQSKGNLNSSDFAMPMAQMADLKDRLVAIVAFQRDRFLFTKAKQLQWAVIYVSVLLFLIALSPVTSGGLTAPINEKETSKVDKKQSYKTTNIPIIQAGSLSIDIKDNGKRHEGAWTIMPEYKPDIYVSNNLGAEVTFYTDLDSISYTIHQDSVYDFMILVNGTDTAFTQIKYEPTHLEILKKADIYNNNEKSSVPEFLYQDVSNSDLKELRNVFNLDSIAGQGNEVSKILNLMHWIHQLIPHDGSHGNPKVKNAMSLITTCQDENRGLNSRGHCTILNECYLSLGIKSRMVTCLPKDSIVRECHVLNMVYASELEKWIWIDPTYDAYIMDETGMLLGLEEVRERVINGKTLILNPDANWNKKTSTVKEHYFYEYMAKNLYRFSCPLNSEYDFETRNKEKTTTYVELIPLDGYQQLPKYSERIHDKTGMIIKTYKTNNSQVFWARPK